MPQRGAHQCGHILSHLCPSYCLAIFDFAFRLSEMASWTKKTSRLEFNSWMTKLVLSTLSALYDYTALVAARDLYHTPRTPSAPFQPTASYLPLLVSKPPRYPQWLIRYDTVSLSA